MTADRLSSKLAKREKGIWQRRYWDHIIRSHEDFRLHLDYIHCNAVKHGLVNSPEDWEYSSFRHFLKKGLYAPNWGNRAIDFGDNDFGE